MKQHKKDFTMTSRLSKPSKLPVFKIFKQTFQSIFSHFGEWLRVILVLSCLSLGISALSFYITEGIPFQGDTNLTVSFFLGNPYIFLGFLVCTLLGMYVTLAFTVNASRYAFLGEGGEKWFSFPVKRALKLLAYYIMFFVPLLLIVALIIYGVTEYIEASILGYGLVLFLCIVPFLYISVRLSLFPYLVAIDQKKAFRTSWALLKGNVLRALLISVLLSPFVLLNGVLSIPPVMDALFYDGFFLLTLLRGASSLLTALLYAQGAAFAYQYLKGEEK